MTLQIGRRVNIGLAAEGTRKTWEAPDYWYPWTSLSFDDRYEVLSDESARGVIEGVSGAAKSKQWAEGSIEGIVKSESFGLILKSLFGTEATPALVETGVYDHVFTVAQSAQHQSLAVTKKDDAETRGFAGGVVTSVELEATTDDFVMATVGLKARAGSAQTATVAYSTEYSFVRSGVTLGRATSLAGLSSATAVSVKSFKLTINPNVIDDDVLGDDDPNDFYNTVWNMEAEFELKQEDSTFKDFVANQTATWYQLTLTNATTIGAASFPTLTFKFSDVKHEAWERKDEKDEIIGQTIKIVGKYSATDSQMMSATLRNTKTAAY